MNQKLLAALKRVIAAEDLKPPRKQIIPWLYGNCWSFALGLEEVFGYSLQLLVNEDDAPDHAFTTAGNKSIDAAGVTTPNKLLRRYPGSSVDEEEDEIGSLVSSMSTDYSDEGYSVNDAVAFIKKYKDFYDPSKGYEPYEKITQKEVNESYE